MSETQLPAAKPKESPTQSMEIRLLGQKIPIRTSEKDPELVSEVVGLVSVLLKNAEMRAKGAAAHQIALLALLDLAQEYSKAKRKTAAYKRDVNDKTARLKELVRDCLK
ncbi:MAG: hypothetical protein A2X94_03710 [Bdellovibrionales bacterium GWB1_55_8]|nr:MAG: hypothetical protein A2X94_03710 [Bdellovibrionales bacterium GWB1_55_8]